MLNPFLPRRVDNAYHGQKVALWIFALLVFIKTAISLNSIFNGYLVASSADGIPLDRFAPAAVQTVVSLFALLGLSTLVICLLCVLVLLRYRSLIPLMFALLLVEFLCRRLILGFLPIPRTGTPPGSIVNLVLLALMIVGLSMSVWSQDKLQAQE